MDHTVSLPCHVSILHLLKPQVIRSQMYSVAFWTWRSKSKDLFHNIFCAWQVRSGICFSNAFSEIWLKRMGFRLWIDNNVPISNNLKPIFVFLTICGAGGSRTLVQTGKSYAFYMLIPAFGFRASARPGPPTDALSSKTSQRAWGKPSAIPEIIAPLYQSASGNGLWAMSRSNA